MLLNVETIYNDSKKISELRKLTKITKHQENTWFPMAQYNSRTDTYTNAAINLQAITSYNIEHAYSYVASEFGSYWVRLKAVGDATSFEGNRVEISRSEIASNIVGYTFTYTLQYLDWQIVNGTYVPDYYAPLHPDDTESEQVGMQVPDFSIYYSEEDAVEENANNTDNDEENNNTEESSEENDVIIYTEDTEEENYIH